MPKRYFLPPRSDSPFPWVPWGFSLIFPIAVIALAGTVLVSVLAADEPDGSNEPGEIAAALATDTPANVLQQDPLQPTAPGSDPVIVADEPPPVAATPTLAAGPIVGVITDASGNPVQGARITDGSSMTVTGADGIFQLDFDDPDPSAGVRISASGFHDWTGPMSALGNRSGIVLETRQINAIYMNPNMSGTDEDIDRFIEIIDTTSANAVVIDIKEEIIYYDSKVELFVDAGTVRPIMDLAEVIQKFKDHGIYTIARLVVFKDGLVARANPDMAVLNNQTGDLWRDDNGVAWVNPMVHALWDANAELAVEAAGYGFDEIQYDYVRFPTDGDFSTMDFGIENTQANREKSIEGFLAQAREALLPTGAKQSADVFGYTLLVDDDLGIGQNFPRIAEHVDYISPMIYPSHWPNGSLAVDGHPNDFPYETIEISMRKAGEKLDGDMLRVRPWLQDFNYFDLMPYGDDEVRAQIDAVEDAGGSGWMLWDPNNRYHPGGLDPDPRSTTPLAATPGASPTVPLATPGTPVTWRQGTRGSFRR